MTKALAESRWGERLDQGLSRMSLSVPADVGEHLLRFISLLLKWNKAYNLTAVRDPLEMVDRHLLDSLSVLPYLHGEEILDMGTGPGLPGIPLALLRPDAHFVLLDSNNKKIRFVRQVVLELGIVNVIPVHARVETYQPNHPFDTLISRAFTALPRMVELTRHLRAPGCRLLAMKGMVPEDEIAGLPAGMIKEVIRLQVPFTDAERHLIIVE